MAAGLRCLLQQVRFTLCTQAKLLLVLVNICLFPMSNHIQKVRLQQEFRHGCLNSLPAERGDVRIVQIIYEGAVKARGEAFARQSLNCGAERGQTPLMRACMFGG